MVGRSAGAGQGSEQRPPSLCGPYAIAWSLNCSLAEGLERTPPEVCPVWIAIDNPTCRCRPPPKIMNWGSGGAGSCEGKPMARVAWAAFCVQSAWHRAAA